MDQVKLLVFRFIVAVVTNTISILSHFSFYFPKGVRRYVDRDLRLVSALASTVLHSSIVANQNLSAAGLLEQTARKHPTKTAFRYNDTDWTFQQIDDYANQVANFFQSRGQLKKGDCVALVSSSCPQYIAIWLGLNKIGCVTALINYQLKTEALRHAITSADSKVAIIGADLLPNYLAIQADLTTVQQCFEFCEGNISAQSGQLPCFDEFIASMPTSKPSVAHPVGYYDKLVYVYTSGTTGLPKPCIITTHRAFSMAVSLCYTNGFTKDDVLLCTLPLYHTSGGLVSVGHSIFMGLTVVLKKSFSASRFWDDVRTNGCTAFIYIGELCRYILAQPPSPRDKSHTLRYLTGVGLRKEIWSELVNRFNIKGVLEYYASTEGNAVLANTDGFPGAIGFMSTLLEKAKQQFLIRVDMETGVPIRGGNGLCVKCKANEPGEMVGRISSSKFNSFDGYLDKKATAKKHLTDVFQKGDLFFRTGDILVKDKDGYVFFVDRAGDTFRWKGENVSTTEVEGTISRLSGGVDVAVFGVSVPGCDGKAGMACIASSDKEVNMQKFSQDLNKHLTSYARPLFLRYMPWLELTGTFKIMKTGLKEAAFDPMKCEQDPLYYYDAATYGYQRITPETYQRICTGDMRL